MKKLVITFIALTSLYGCKSTQAPISYEQISIPQISAKTSVYLGERMLMQAKGYYGNCIAVSGGNGVQSSIKAGKFCQSSSSSNLYFSSDKQAVGLKNGYGNVVSYADYVTYKPDTNAVCASPFSCYDSSEMNIEFIDNDLVVEASSLQQVIEYNGRAGTILNFTYREFASGMARAAYTTDFKMDLNEGNEIGYKGSRLVIHEATNNKVTYTVLKNFN